MDSLLVSLGFSEKETSLAQAVVAGRLIEPGSDLNTWKWLLTRTSLPELLPRDIRDVGKDAVYEIADQIFLHKDAIERHLRQTETNLFSYSPTLYLYDLTNTYFEGNAKNNTLAKRGKSKEKRSDCPLVTLALAVDEMGFPLFSQIYSGNQSEPKTLPDVLKKLEKDMADNLFNEIRPTIVMDRGIATNGNLKLLKKGGYPYIVIERRPTEKDYKEDFASLESFTKLKVHSSDKDTSAVYVKKVSLETGCRVLCFSEGREQKEHAMDALKEKRFLEDIEKLNASVTAKNIIMVEKVAERLGRIKARYPSITHYYDSSLYRMKKILKKWSRYSGVRSSQRKRRTVYMAVM